MRANRLLPCGWLLLAVTLVAWNAAAFALADDAATDSDKSPFYDPLAHAPLPESITSFGAAVSGDYLYVFSGATSANEGDPLSRLSQHFRRLNLAQPGSEWEELAMHRPAQSTALLAWKDRLYRVGGLSFKLNEDGSDTLFNSTTEFASYDPQTNTWTDLPPLPQSRSSIDAAIVDGRVYVVGGWNLQGESSGDAPWHENALVFDLTAKNGKWEEIAPPPFVKRALAAVAHDHKLFVLGGMASDNQISNDVHFYDPTKNTWTAGPALPTNGRLGGFAISSFAAGGALYFSGIEGVLYRLKDDLSGWEPQQRLLQPRFFHRLLRANDQELVAVAGTASGGRLTSIETLALEPKGQVRPKLTQWKVKFGGQAKHSQALAVSGSSLYALGGNLSRGPHDFSQEAFLKESFKFNLNERTVEKLPDLPHPVQSSAAVVSGSSRDSSIYVLGGIGHDGKDFGSTSSIYRYRVRSENWTDDKLSLPESRAMFEATSYDDAVWMFGGSQVNQDQGLSKEVWRWSGFPEDPVEVLSGITIPSPRRSFGAAQLDNHYYLVGGLGDGAEVVAATDVFDFETRKWSKAASPLVPRVFASVAAVGGKLYLAGGFARVNGHFSEVKTVEVYDPQTDAWQVAFEALPFPAQTVLAYQDRLLFYGIDRQEDGVAQFALLDPTPMATDYGNASTTSRFERGNDSGEVVVRVMRMDENNDGKLSKEEVGDRMVRFVERADTDKDGFATREEVEALVKRESEENREGTDRRNRRGNRSND